MLSLPKIPYRMEKNKSQVVAMRGINFSNMIADGDMVDSKNISARAYPYITTRKAREDLGDEYNGASAITIFQDRLVYVKGNDLYWGDKHWANSVSVGAKQFATINTKLVIMPDKIYIDGETGELGYMGARSLIHADITANTIIAGEGYSTWFDSYNAYVEGDKLMLPRRVHISNDDNIIMKWTSARWDGSPGYFFRYNLSIREKIHFDGVGSLHVTKTYDFTYGDGYLETTAANVAAIASRVAVGDEIILGREAGSQEFTFTVSAIENKRIYGKKISVVSAGMGDVRDISKVFVDITKTTTASVKEYSKVHYGGEIGEPTTVVNEHGMQISVSTSISEEWMPCYFDNGGYDGSIKSDIRVGDKIKLNGTDVTKTVSAVGDYEYGEYIEFAGSAAVGDKGRVEISKQSDISGFKVGDAVTILGSDANDMTFIIDDIKDGVIYAESDIFTAATNDSFIIERRIPDLDFICESGNRVWGCSNADNTIYASALGDPTNFFDYSGESTDSYAVAVGSPDKFTACCRYGSNVLFFKENKIHKMLGSYPAEYTLYSYDMEGVQEGSHKSLQVINEVLYYKGAHGIFAYNGAPALISANFGDLHMWDAVAGNDGDTYYVSMSGSGRDYLFAYETKHGMWVLEDNIKMVDFVKSRSSLRMLTKGGKFYLCDVGESEPGIEWHIQFAPLYETLEGKKIYSRIVMRVELPLASHLAVSIRTDGWQWFEVGKVVGKRDGIVPVSIPINRCDKFELRIKGKGKCTIHQIKREFFVGGDK